MQPDIGLTLFYSVLQSVCYIVCYHGDLLKWGQSRLVNVVNDDSDIKQGESVSGADDQTGNLAILIQGSNSLLSILRSHGSALGHCRREIVTEFISTCR